MPLVSSLIPASKNEFSLTDCSINLGLSRVGDYIFLCAAGAGIVLLLNILFYDKSKSD